MNKKLKKDPLLLLVLTWVISLIAVKILKIE